MIMAVEQLEMSLKSKIKKGESLNYKGIQLNDIDKVFDLAQSGNFKYPRIVQLIIEKRIYVDDYVRVRLIAMIFESSQLAIQNTKLNQNSAATFLLLALKNNDYQMSGAEKEFALINAFELERNFEHLGQKYMMPVDKIVAFDTRYWLLLNANYKLSRELVNSLFESNAEIETFLHYAVLYFCSRCAHPAMYESMKQGDEKMFRALKELTSKENPNMLKELDMLCSVILIYQQLHINSKDTRIDNLHV